MKIQKKIQTEWPWWDLRREEKKEFEKSDILQMSFKGKNIGGAEAP